mmetsp:Transcript_118267/g.235564  ORF Transcript_118267/g.235564 Transcript_118267/m.235564 type:complete len:208 (+) Transcript_118267:155-778(+)
MIPHSFEFSAIVHWEDPSLAVTASCWCHRSLICKGRLSTPPSAPLHSTSTATSEAYSLQVGVGNKHQASLPDAWQSCDSETSKLLCKAPATARALSSSARPTRMPLVIAWMSARLACTSSISASVTSTCMPTRNHKSSPVVGLLATVKPRMSRRLRNSSPDLRRFSSIAVKGAPLTQAARRFARSTGSKEHPAFRNRQFFPRTSELM